MKRDSIKKGKRTLATLVMRSMKNLFSPAPLKEDTIAVMSEQVKVLENKGKYAKLWYEGSSLHIYAGKHLAVNAYNHFQTEGFEVSEPKRLDGRLHYVWVHYE